MIHDTGDEAARESLARLLVAAGKGVEIEELDALRVVALIAPQDLENCSKDEVNG